VHSVSHVTGGGLSANVARVLPQGLVAKMSRASWEVPAVVSVLGVLGGVPQAHRERTWNPGVGMVLVVDPAMAEGVREASPGAGGVVGPRRAGRRVAGRPRTHLEPPGRHGPRRRPGDGRWRHRSQSRRLGAR